MEGVLESASKEAILDGTKYLLLAKREIFRALSRVGAKARLNEPRLRHGRLDSQRLPNHPRGRHGNAGRLSAPGRG